MVKVKHPLLVKVVWYVMLIIMFWTVGMIFFQLESWLSLLLGSLFFAGAFHYLIKFGNTLEKIQVLIEEGRDNEQKIS